ncbi:MAG: TIR domain-containing protein [Oscillospiraceae bacterium]
MRVFISHSSINSDAAQELCKKLEDCGFDTFIAPRDIRPGYEYAEELLNGIDSCDMMVLLLSQDSNTSPHVLREVERAVSTKKPIVVYKLEEVTLTKSLEYFLMTHQWVNAKPGRDWDEVATHVADYFNRHQAAPDGQKGVDWKPEQPPVSSKSRKRLPFVFAALAAVLVVAAGVVIPIVLHNGGIKPADSTGTTLSEPNSDTDSSLSDTPELPDNSTVESSAAPESKPTSDSPSAAKTSLGAKITFGTYNNEPIVWRVINISEDGKTAVVLADNIITMKAFDAAECGEFNELNDVDYWRTKTADLDAETQRLVRGDNRWECSNIRNWLNSERTNVSYSDQAPSSSAMSEKRNGYDTEAGFLNAFSADELSSIAVTDVETNGVVTQDKVFLLSEEELKWLETADVSLYAKPTAAAVEQDKSNWYKVEIDAYGVEDFVWWLRTPNPDNACECKCVNLSYFKTKLPIRSDFAGLEGFGVRPAMTLDLTSDKMISVLAD